MYTSYSRRSIGQLNRNRRFEIGVSSAIARDMIFDETVGAPVKRCVATEIIEKGNLVIQIGETFYLVESKNPYFKNYFHIVIERDGEWLTSDAENPDRSFARLVASAQAHKAELGKKEAVRAASTVTEEVLTARLETPAKFISAGQTIYHVCGQIVVYEWIWNAWECTCCEDDGHGASYRNCEHVQAVLAHLN